MCGYGIGSEARRGSVRNYIPVCALALLLLLLLHPQLSMGADSGPIALVYRKDLPLHQQIAQEISHSLAREDPGIVIVDWPLSSAWPPASEKEFAGLQPSFAIALGDIALTFCRRASPDLSGFFLLVSNQDQVAEAEGSGLWTGAGLWVKPEKQLEKFRALLPGAKTLGSVVSAGFFSKEQLTSLQQTGERFGFALDIVEVAQRRDVLAAIARVYKRNDGFWMMPDPQLLNEITLAEMLRLQTDYARPLLALSPRFVQLGALLSINTSLAEVSKQAVIFARKSAGSRDLGHMEPLPDSCYIIHINSDVAGKLDFKAPEAMQSSFDFITLANGGKP